MRVARRMCWLILSCAACGSGSGSTTATPSSTPPAPATSTVMVGAGGNFSFSPQTVSINAGDTVMWQWADGSIAHTVTSGTPGHADGQFCSLPAGEAPSATACDSTSYAQSSGTYSHTFPTAGSFSYYCTVHGAMMTGTVVVGGSGGGGGGGGSTGGGGGY
jgi:plastocyanin